MSDPTDDRGKVAEPALPELKNQEQFCAYLVHRLPGDRAVENGGGAI